MVIVKIIIQLMIILIINNFEYSEFFFVKNSHKFIFIISYFTIHLSNYIYKSELIKLRFSSKAA